VHVYIGTTLCKCCAVYFATPGHFGRHLKDEDNKDCKQRFETQVQSFSDQHRRVQHRARLTVDTKCKILDTLKQLEEQNIPLQVCLAHHPGISPKNLSTWSSLREKLYDAKARGFGQSRYLAVASRVQFAAEENELYMEFVFEGRCWVYLLQTNSCNGE